MVTSNHVHLLLWAKQAAHVSAAMHFLEGNVARDYNRRKTREGALWRGRYHPTLIQTGSHLSHCLFYIDLNMVRAGAVKEPSAWLGGAYDELCGQRERYRIINLSRLLNCLGFGERPEEFRRWYAATMQEVVAGVYLARQRVWSEAAAVGTREWLAGLAVGMRGAKFEVLPPGGTPTGVLAESQGIYTLRLSSRQQRDFWAARQQAK
jgi:putative transposase